MAPLSLLDSPRFVGATAPANNAAVSEIVNVGTFHRMRPRDMNRSRVCPLCQTNKRPSQNRDGLFLIQLASDRRAYPSDDIHLPEPLRSLCLGCGLAEGHVVIAWYRQFVPALGMTLFCDTPCDSDPAGPIQEAI